MLSWICSGVFDIIVNLGREDQAFMSKRLNWQIFFLWFFSLFFLVLFALL
jgi:hypothetical protein